jgi:hypothetical protein
MLPSWSLLLAITSLSRSVGINTFLRVLTSPFGNGPYGQRIDLAGPDLATHVITCMDRRNRGEAFTIENATTAAAPMKRALTFAEKLEAAVPRGIGGPSNITKRARPRVGSPPTTSMCRTHPKTTPIHSIAGT